ncbi:Delta-12 fatty acid desaturase protein [Mycena chlorophos]|uniref:Delta-12 fatty acid desaturase protein n=2 Tax=Mycena chlorophos TaxID=658473 RepID=A0A146IM67_MYCCL|nr:Delta-12 fatty acid desaturase protein [Mycena chlorophos]GAT60703.1 delta-12 fatty acid desaturase protein [Mycena chlorophos]
MFSYFADSPEYLKRKESPFSPSNISIGELRAALPKEVFQRSTALGLYYYARDIVSIYIAYRLGAAIDPFAQGIISSYGLEGFYAFAFRWALWATYWHWQGVILAGFWQLAHEAGHGTLSDYPLINSFIGFPAHSFLLTPYFSWRASHRLHHKKANCIEDDENWCPETRKDLGLPPPEKAKAVDYADILEETPIYTLYRMFLTQVFGLHIYFFNNTSGQPTRPAGTSHFLPSSPLFKPEERNAILLSDVGIIVMLAALSKFTLTYGFAAFIKLYLVPWILCNHWVVAVTHLHHSDPTIPMFRRKEWNYVRGALSTVDRPVLGWAGQFFLKNVSHNHVTHHLFSTIPFYNQPKATEAIKPLVKEHYNTDSTNTLRALYRTFAECRFIEDEGDIIFYRNKHGETARQVKTEKVE